MIGCEIIKRRVKEVYGHNNKDRFCFCGFQELLRHKKSKAPDI